MTIILWVVVIPSVASVLIYFLIEFIRLARRGYASHQTTPEVLPAEDGGREAEDEPEDGNAGRESGEGTEAARPGGEA